MKKLLVIALLQVIFGIAHAMDDAEANAQIMAKCEESLKKVNLHIINRLVEEGATQNEPFEIGSCALETTLDGKRAWMQLPTQFASTAFSDQHAILRLEFGGYALWYGDGLKPAREVQIGWEWNKAPVTDKWGHLLGYKYSFENRLQPGTLHSYRYVFRTPTVVIGWITIEP